MSHHHAKTKHKKEHDDTKTKKTDHGDDTGKLSDAMKNKEGDDDEVTPGYQPVTPDMPTDIQSDMVNLEDLGNDPYDDVDRSKVTANVGAEQGIVEEMQAYLLMNNGDKLAFNITEVRDKATLGSVEGSAYYLRTNSTWRVVFNPATPHKKKDHKKKHHHHGG